VARDFFADRLTRAELEELTGDRRLHQLLLELIEQ